VQDVVLVREDDVAVEVRVATAAAVAVALKTFKVSVVLVGCEGLSDVPLPLLPLHFGSNMSSCSFEVARHWRRCAIASLVTLNDD
jgi:hypothetical protein